MSVFFVKNKTEDYCHFFEELTLLLSLNTRKSTCICSSKALTWIPNAIYIVVCLCSMIWD